MSAAYSVEDHDDLTEVNQVRDAMRILDGYYGQIASAGQVSRRQAQALVAECGVQFDERYPDNSFTEAPSPTNYAITMESILRAGGRMVMDLIRKAAELLMKIVAWCIQTAKEQFSRTKNYLRVRENLGTVHAQVVAVRDLPGVKAAEAMDHPPHELAAARQALAGAVSRYEDGFTRLSSDLQMHGPLTRLIRDLSVAALGIIPKVDDKLTLFDKVLTTHTHGDATDELAQLSQLKTIATPLEASGLRRMADKVLDAHDPQQTAGEVLTSVYRRVAEFAGDSAEDRPTLDQLVEQITDQQDVFTAPFVVIPQQAVRQLESLEQKLRRLQGIEPSAQASDKIREAFSNAVTSVSQDIQGIRSYFIAVRYCIGTQERMLHDALAYESAYFELQRVGASVSKDPTTIEEVNKAIDAISHAARR